MVPLLLFAKILPTYIKYMCVYIYNYIKGRRYYHNKYHGLWNLFMIDVSFFGQFIFYFGIKSKKILARSSPRGDEMYKDVNDIANYSIV